MKKPVVAVLLLDVGLPLGAYYGARAVGLSEYLSLDAISMVMFLMFGVGLVLSFVTGEDRMLLVLQSGTTAALGLYLIATCLFGAPAAFGASKRFRGGDAELVRKWNAKYAEEPAFKRIFVMITLAWGLTLLGEAVLRVPVAYLLPRWTSRSESPR